MVTNSNIIINLTLNSKISRFCTINKNLVGKYQHRTANLVRKTKWELTIRSRNSEQKCFRAYPAIQEHKEAIKTWRKLEMHACKMHFLYHAMVLDEKCKLTRLKNVNSLNLFLHVGKQTHEKVRNKADRWPNVWGRHNSAGKK